MQFSQTIAIMAIAISSVAAVPWATTTTTAAAPAPTCASSTTQVCCTSIADLVALDCILSSLLGTGCTAQTICCNNVGSGDQTCTEQDGTTVDVLLPITITL